MIRSAINWMTWCGRRIREGERRTLWHVAIGVPLIFLPLVVQAAALKPIGPPQDDVMKFAFDFRKAVLERNMPFLNDVTSEIGGIDDETLKFIYGPRSVGRGIAPRKPAAEILSSDRLEIGYENEKVPTYEKAQGQQYFLLFFRPNHGQFENLSVGYVAKHRKWMVDFVACDVERRSNGWKLIGSFCFNETDIFR